MRHSILQKRLWMMGLFIVLCGSSWSAVALTWIGNIEARPTTNEGVWTVSAVSFVVNANTQLVTSEGSLQVGRCVNIEYLTDTEGKNNVSRIESLNRTFSPNCPAEPSTTQTPPASQANCVVLDSELTHAYTYNNGTQQIFARNTKNEVQEFWRSQNNPTWKLENLSKHSGADITFIGNPVFQRSYYWWDDIQQVFIRDKNNELRELWWTPSRGWTLENLTAQTRSPTALNNPVFQRDDALQQVFFVDKESDIRELWWTPSRGWTIENLSQQTGNIKARSDLSFVRSGYYDESNYFIHSGSNVQYLFAIDEEGALREWQWTFDTGWKTYLVSRDFKFAGNPLFRPIIRWMFNTPQLYDLVYVRTEKGELLQFERIKSQNGFTLVQDWKVTNISDNLANKQQYQGIKMVLASDINFNTEYTSTYSENYLSQTIMTQQRLFGRDSEGNLIEMRQTIQTIRLVSDSYVPETTPPPNFEYFNISKLANNTQIVGMPIYSLVSGVEYLFARNQAGQLLEFWRLKSDASSSWQVVNVNESVCKQ